MNALSSTRDIMNLIFCELDIKSLLRSQQVCKSWKNWIDNEELWKKLAASKNLSKELNEGTQSIQAQVKKILEERHPTTVKTKEKFFELVSRLYQSADLRKVTGILYSSDTDKSSFIQINFGPSSLINNKKVDVQHLIKGKDEGDFKKVSEDNKPKKTGTVHDESSNFVQITHQKIDKTIADSKMLSPMEVLFILNNQKNHEVVQNTLTSAEQNSSL